MLTVVDTLAKDEEFTSGRLGLGRSAIMHIIQKYLDEGRHKESEQLEATGKMFPVSGSESGTTSNVSGDSPESDEGKSTKLEDYYNTGESYMYILDTFLVYFVLW